jgi:hypothetical protein
MKRISSSAAIVLGGALILSMPKFTPSAPKAGLRLEIDMCEFKVPPELAQANASFIVTYIVQVEEDGHPLKVDKVRNDFLTDGPFVHCIKSWILPPGSRQLAVSFTWKHGQGWTELAITGQDFNYLIRFEPGAFAQYRTGGD